MLTPKNNANQMRTRILVKIVEKFLQNRFNDADRIPLELRPKGEPFNRCCIYKDRAILKYRCMAGMGFAPEDEKDELTTLREYGEQAMARTQHAPNKLSVITDACSACIKSRYMVTDACRGCFAQPCKVNCPKQAISIVDGRSHIDETKCIACGRCQEVCPYHAVIRVPIPCEEACPVGAISKDETGKEHIDPEKCIFCGKCLHSCPFGAVVEMSQIVDVLKALNDSDKKVVAMLAPAVIGQFPGTINQLISALKKIGFSDVVEVAVGADITTQNEAAEFVEKMEHGEKLMTTSCCPAYYKAAEVHIPEIKPFVSHTQPPMYYTAELLKKEQPDCIAVFVGPCLAKRIEAERNPNVDYVLTFEEVGAMLVAGGVFVMDCEPQEFTKISCAQGRRFPVSGGVAGAVQSLVEGKADYRPFAINGLNKANIKLLKQYATKGCDYNMIEVMTCEGGCVAGPGCIALAKKAAIMVENYVKEGPNLKDAK
ncbi:MAG: monomeric [FeFe] hydrogenase [Rhodospirillales bacterium]|nr:monomeric [FeFe] hydrogenase [Rhodospirillales bacterium]